ERYAAAKAGRGQTVFVRGEPGIGKSRLLHELRRRLAEEDLTWLEGHCITYGRDISYFPIVELLKDAFEIDEGDSEATIIRQVEAGTAALGDGAVAGLPYLKHALAVDPGDPAVLRLDAQLRKAHTFEAVRAVLTGAAARRPLVLAVEDIHW